MKIRTRTWLKTLLAGGCLIQLSSCIGDPAYFFASTTANWLAATVVRLFFSTLIG